VTGKNKNTQKKKKKEKSNFAREKPTRSRKKKSQGTKKSYCDAKLGEREARQSRKRLKRFVKKEKEKRGNIPKGKSTKEERSEENQRVILAEGLRKRNP